MSVDPGRTVYFHTRAAGQVRAERGPYYVVCMDPPITRTGEGPAEPVRYTYTPLPPAPLDEIREWLFLVSSNHCDGAPDFETMEAMDRLFDAMRVNLEKIARTMGGP